MNRSDEQGLTRSYACFNTTHWSVVLAAGQPGSSQAGAALEALCRSYWYPLYAYLRRRGFSPADAQDLTQGFFTRLLQKNLPAQADRAKGKFRSFLLMTLDHFLADERERRSAGKRGGGQVLLSLDAEAPEERYRLEPVDEATPEKLFERRWAQTILDQALTRLRDEYATAGKADTYAVLQAFGPGKQKTLSYTEAAGRLGVTESALKSIIHRMRQRHRDLVREVIAQTVTTASEVDEELHHLIAVISE
jgi:RNA polymerase sigma-70 factor (ECF subfamily)